MQHPLSAQAQILHLCASLRVGMPRVRISHGAVPVPGCSYMCQAHALLTTAMLALIILIILMSSSYLSGITHGGLLMVAMMKGILLFYVVVLLVHVCDCKRPGSPLPMPSSLLACLQCKTQ